jgi:hypothetical protein
MTGDHRVPKSTRAALVRQLECEPARRFRTYGAHRSSRSGEALALRDALLQNSLNSRARR